MKNQTTTILAIIVGVLVLATGIVYFVATIEQIGEAQEGAEESAGEASFDLGSYVETALFATIAGAYIPVAVWLLRHRSSNTPYVISAIGSAALIGLYIASRTVDLPIVGIQDDVGSLDILAKTLQGGIVVGAVMMLTTIRKSRTITV